MQYLALAARRIVLDGRVQGVGFRPFVYRLAHVHDVHGWVYNDAGSVHVQAEGSAPALERFTAELLSQAPPLARPHLVRSESVPIEGHPDFRIRASHADSQPSIHVPPDYYLCDDCLKELRDPAARRYRYPFINCTQCGPRYTLIRAMPYDRPNTTMADFLLCPECQSEYSNPLDRRFHAQPLGCPVCGPHLSFKHANGIIEGNEPALAACVAALERGEIIAVRGIGGYHLVCDARNDKAVTELRAHKQRPHKPLALMVPLMGSDGLDAARQIVQLNKQQAALLLDPMRPIVLARCNPQALIAPGIAPGLQELGIMLPYNPLHHLLLGDFGRPVVATSGNISGEPVLTDAQDVERRLGKVADACLHHNRPIQRPADDPVFRFVAGQMRPLRIGRGNAPLELNLPFRLARPLLATGAFLKNTVALAWQDRVVISPHIGDLESARGQRVFKQVANDLQELYGIQADILACDAHPDFPNTRWAKHSGLPVIPVYHHHAHAAAAVGEYNISEPCLCFTWDGVGLGDDGTLWGGETLLGRPGAWRRVASLRPFRLPGGERAAREPWRSALGICWETGAHWQQGDAFTDPLMHKAWQAHMNSPVTTSVGRLFDAAAALVGCATQASFEGQGPMLLEALCEQPGEPLELPLVKDDAGLWRMDWSPLISMLMDARMPAALRSARFHASLAQVLLVQANAIRQMYGVQHVALTGGVFQNAVLAQQAQALLAAHGFDVHIPLCVPVNDAGISYGQIIEAGARCLCTA
ncbi:MAG: carbamoyltransferase HypF [Gammaproteobacteria bacterium]